MNKPAAVDYNAPDVLDTLACDALEIATESARPEVVLEWSERGRMLASRVRPVRPPVLDLGALGAEAMAEGRRLTVAEARRTFDLAAGPLFRCLLLRRSGTDHTLVATFHHLVFDGWSGAVFARELGAAYGAALAGTEPPWTPLPWQYPDFARWQRRRLTGGVVERQLEYWRQRLEAAPRSLDLPTDRPRPTVQDLAGRTLPVSFPEPLAQGLEALARDSGATLFMALALGTAMLLARWSGARDVILGSPVAGRTDRRLEGLIGFFVNALPLRFELAGATGFRAALSRARDRLLEDFDHQELPFERLVEELHPERDLSRDPIFQAMVVSNRLRDVMGLGPVFSTRKHPVP